LAGLRHIVFVVDVANPSSLALFRDMRAKGRAGTLLQCGVLLVFGADDASRRAFALKDLMVWAGECGLLTPHLPAPYAGVDEDNLAVI
jgi:hypothetical protein